MCAQTFQKPLNLNIRHPEVIYKRNAHVGCSAGGWERSACSLLTMQCTQVALTSLFHTMSSFGIHRQQSHTWLDSMILKALSNLNNCMVVWLKSLLFLSVHSTYIWLHSRGLGSRTNKRTVEGGLDVMYRGAVLQPCALFCLGYDCNRAGKQINSAKFISEGSFSLCVV